MTKWVAGIYFHGNRSCRFAPAHQGMKSRSCGLVQRIGTVDSAEPHPDPSGGQAPALHFLIPPSAIGVQFGTFRRWRAGIEVDWRAHFRTNRPSRLVPAHQGMKMRPGRWKCLGVVGATLPLWIPAFAGMTRWVAGIYFHGNPPGWRRIPAFAGMTRWGGGYDEVGGGNLFSWQSLMPAGAGTPRYEKQELWFGTANRHGGFC